MPAGLAPYPRWNAIEQFGVFAPYGKVYTYENGDRSTNKPTYPDPSATPGTELSNPIPLESDGGAVIYWDTTTSLYSIDVYDRLGNLIATADNYAILAGTTSTGPITVNQSVEGLLINPKYSNWNQGSTIWNRGDLIPEPFQFCDAWFFGGAAADSVMTLQAINFALGQTVVPDNPIRFTRYTCTNVGSGGETDKFIFQPLNIEEYEPEGKPFGYMNGVQALANQPVALSIWAASSTLSVIEPRVDQYFGSGGSPSALVSTPFPPITLTNTLTQYRFTIIVPNISGKTLGTNGDDQTRFTIGLPLNTIAQIDLSSNFFQRGVINTPPNYRTPTQELNDEILVLLGNWRTGTEIIGWSPTQTLFEYLSQSVNPIGKVIFGIFPTPPEGWLAIDDGTIGNTGSGATNRANIDTQTLYTLLWNRADDSNCPVSGGRGASALDDFNALKTIRLPLQMCRAIGATGTGAGLTPRAFADSVGEENHVLTVGELAAHHHQLDIFDINLQAESGSGAGSLIGVGPSQTEDTGNDEGHNTMQPTTFWDAVIRYL